MGKTHKKIKIRREWDRHPGIQIKGNDKVYDRRKEKSKFKKGMEDNED